MGEREAEVGFIGGCSQTASMTSSMTTTVTLTNIIAIVAHFAAVWITRYVASAALGAVVALGFWLFLLGFGLGLFALVPPEGSATITANPAAIIVEREGAGTTLAALPA